VAKLVDQQHRFPSSSSSSTSSSSSSSQQLAQSAILAVAAFLHRMANLMDRTTLLTTVHALTLRLDSVVRYSFLSKYRKLYN
jgi:hypothetical protein